MCGGEELSSQLRSIKYSTGAEFSNRCWCCKTWSNTLEATILKLFVYLTAADNPSNYILNPIPRLSIYFDEYITFQIKGNILPCYFTAGKLR